VTRITSVPEFHPGGGGGGGPGLGRHGPEKGDLDSRRRMTMNLSLARFILFSFLQNLALEDGVGRGSIWTTRSMVQVHLYSFLFFSLTWQYI
jgi:hypothetical protein